ncbi:hypothetical protein AAG906_025671 [Vitis piasezkii]
MSHSRKIYDTCIGCTQCVRALRIYKLLRSKEKTASVVRDVNLSNDFLSVRVYLWHETTRIMGLAY